MKKIRVYLQFPWRFSDSNYYKSLLEYPPENVEYLGKVKNPGNTINKKKLKVNNRLKRAIKKIIKKINPSMPNAHLTKSSQKYDLIHCAHCLSLNKSPWVADIEHAGQFWAAISRKKLGTKKIKKILKSKYCKKILIWSEWGKAETLKKFPELEPKIEILHYAIPPQKKSKQKKGKLRLTFISRRFYFKGGLHALEVMNRLTKKYPNIEGLVVSDTPKEIIKKYKNNKKIKFLDLQPYEKIMTEILPKTDIFLYPSYTDTYGFLIIEALAFGVPIIAVDGHSRKELIEDGKTGFVLNRPKNWDDKRLYKVKGNLSLLQEMEDKASMLIENKKLRTQMGKNAMKEVRNGKFSLKERNRKLKKIYAEATKNESK